MDAYVFACAHLKGGVGKTALSVHMADTLHIQGHRVLIVNLDRAAGSATAWGKVAARANIQGPPVVHAEAEALVRDLPDLARNYDFVFLDCPPYVDVATRIAMTFADLIVIPVNPGAEQIWALEGTLQTLQEARAHRPEVPAVAVINRYQRTALAQSTVAALGTAGVPIAPRMLGQRVAFGEAVAAGQGVVRYDSSSKAAEELLALLQLLLQYAAAGVVTTEEQSQ